MASPNVASPIRSMAPMNRSKHRARSAPSSLLALLCCLVSVALLAITATPAAASAPQDAFESHSHISRPQQPFSAATTPTTSISNDTTPQQAYTRALDLLRSVIDPAALSHFAQAQPPIAGNGDDRNRKTSASTRTKSADGDDNEHTSSAGTSPQRRTPPRRSSSSSTLSSSSSSTQRRTQPRTTLSDLSPYLAFLSSWGPFGTVTRLATRARHNIELYTDRARALLSFGQTQWRVPSGRTAESSSEPSPRGRQGHVHAHSPQWPGEKPAPLWPAWEVDAGQASLHGPFLLDVDGEQTSSSSSPSSSRLATVQLLQYVRKAFAAIVRSTSGASSASSAAATAALARRNEALALLLYAADPPAPNRPSPDALWTLAQHHILGTHGVTPQPWLAVPHLTRLVETADRGNASANSLLGWLYSSRELWKAWGAPAHVTRQAFPGEMQSKALLHQTFAAQQGDYPAQMALAYRHLVGIGTPADCDEALKWYERAAQQSHIRFKQGPVGGLTPPYTHIRLSDLAGGVYGPGASAASTGWAAHRPAIQAALHSLPSAASAFSPDAADPSRLSDLLEFYSYHAAGGSLLYTLRLAQIYYQGSIYGTSESAGRVRRNFAKSRELALRITRRVWPVEVANLKMASGKRVVKGVTTANTPNANANANTPLDEDIVVKNGNFVMAQAGGAAALLGNMYLRGEGVPQDAETAWFWFWRGAEVGDRECQYGFGLVRSLGLAPDQVRHDGKPASRDMKRAVDMWEKAVKAGGLSGHAASSAALGRVHLSMGDYANAGAHFANAVTAGSPFEGFYGLGLVNAQIYKESLSILNPVISDGGGEHRCRSAVTFLKHAAERGDWESPAFQWGLRAWELGDRKRAIVYWSMAAERGDEAAQNNLAYVLDRDRRRWRLPSVDGPEDTSADRLALLYWTRSAAQDNVDALVKLGDYYYHGIGGGKTTTNASSSSPHSPPPRSDYEKALACYATAADRQISALAYWNMGHLYESGRGVPRRDFHLAKRYYDMALEINPEAYFPVMLSLAHLHLKALWATVWKREESAVALFSSYAASAAAANAGAVGGGAGGGGGGAGAGGYTDDGGHRGHHVGDVDGMDDGADLNLPEAYDLRGRERERADRGGEDRSGGGGGGGQARGDSPSSSSSSSDDSSASSTLSSMMSLSDEEADAMIDGAMIVIGLSALAMLVYARQAAQNRAEQERREEERRRRENEGVGAGAGVPVPPPQQQPQGPPRYAGGLPWPPDAAGAANALAGL